MAEDIVSANPDLKPFVLTNVCVTGTKIGGGAYGSVEEVTIPGAVCAAKRIHEVFLDRSEIPLAEISKVSSQFVKECLLTSSLRHPHIVQFLGVYLFPDSRLPALVMERLMMSLHDLLDPETDPPPPLDTQKPFLSLSLKCSILHDVASGLAFLHERSPPIAHRDLSARNVLLNSGMVAKIADLGMARIVPRMRAAATMTKAPGASVYMPPEAIASSASNAERSKYGTSIDIFSLGVVTIFTIGETFPCDLLAPTYLDDSSGLLVARTELQRRSEYMQDVNTQLSAHGQLCEDHLLIELIQQCLHNGPHKRPNICEVLRQLKETKAAISDRASERKLVQAHHQSENQNVECEFATEDAALQSCVQEVTELQQLLQSSDKEKQTIKEQLLEKEIELHKAVESVRREQQQIQEMKHREDVLVEAKNRELAKAQQQIQEMKQREIELVAVKEKELAQAQEQLQEMETKLLLAKDREPSPQQSTTYMCRVSGPGLHSATVNQLTHTLIELSDSSHRPSSFQQEVTAQLISTTPTPTSQSKNPCKTSLSVVTMSPSLYEVLYTPQNRGQHKLHVQVNCSEIDSSALKMTVYPDPTELGHPVRVVTGLDKPYSIAFNSSGDIIITEWDGNKVSIFDFKGQKIRTFGSYGDSPHQMKSPAGIAIDSTNNIYVSSEHKLQKFTSSGELIKCVGQRGKKEGEFDEPRGVTLYDKKVYVCDSDNHRIQVFDLDLNFVRSFGKHGEGKCEFNEPFDVKFDTFGNMYVAEWGNERIQVMDSNGHFKNIFGEQGKGKLVGPSGLYIADKYVYVSDFSHACIVVYETSGQFVTSFGKRGHKEGEFQSPYSITSCVHGFIHVCDFYNDRVQIF